MTWAVPVLPMTSRPASRPRPPVPARFTTNHSPSFTTSSVDGSMAARDFGTGRGAGANPSPSSTALSRCGVTRVPPLATAAIMTASDIGVTDTAPCPMATEMVSPGYHCWSNRSRFQAVEGISPRTSCGRSTPETSPSPRAVAHLWIWSISILSPSA